MTIIAAAAVALTLVGCANFGEGKATGTKYKKTLALDATGDLKDSTGAEMSYSRAFMALSASKNCSEIETEITVPLVNDKKEETFDNPSQRRQTRKPGQRDGTSELRNEQLLHQSGSGADGSLAE